MNVNPGELDKRIQIVKKEDSEKEDDEGFSIEEKEKIIRKCWASFRRTTGKEKIESGREITETECRFLVRRTKTKIDATMHIKYAGEYYDIQNTNDYNDSHEYVEIWCKAVK